MDNSKKPNLPPKSTADEPKNDDMPAFMRDAAENNKAKKRKKHRKWPWVILAIVLVIVGTGGFIGYRIYSSLNKVIVKNTGISAEGLKTENIAPEKLKGEGDGRVNVLLLGVGDPGHAGEQLTDTIMVASYDPKSKDVAMVSLPRDLMVPVFNSSIRINSAYYYGEQNKKGSGAEVAKQTVSKVLGIPVHYFIKLDFTALKRAVDSVGGIDVKVEKTLIDPEYPCEKNENISCGYSIMAGPQHFNGSAALKYARCRKGDCGDDFGRAKRQQEVIVALREKANTQNLLTNPGKIADILQIIGDNVRTDLQVWEIERFAKIGREIDPTKITNKVVDGSSGLVKNSSEGGASVLIPTAGLNKFSEIQAFVRQLFADGYIKSESANLAIQNGTTVPTRGQVTANLLKTYGYTIASVLPADATTYKTSKIIDYTGGKKPYTLQYLQRRFGVSAIVADPATAPAPNVDIVIIVGANYKP